MGAVRNAWIAIAAIIGTISPAFSEVISVPYENSASDPTQTFLWQAKDAKAVLVMIPGGEGHIGLTADKADLGGFYGRVLKPLSDANMTSGRIDVVVFDSPDLLPSGDFYPTSRASRDHLDRIQSVVRFYKERFGKPVWLMGHSNGAISVAEYLRNGGDMVDGVIFSSSRTGVKVPDGIAIPILFLQQRRDGCAKVNAGRILDLYETLKSAGKNNVAYTWIDGGSPQGNPCHSGYHMFFESEAQVYGTIDSFINSN